MAKQPYYEGQEFHNPSDPAAPVLVYRKGQFIQKAADMRGMSNQLAAPEQASLVDARAAATNAISVLDTLNSFQNVNEGRGVKGQNTGGIVGSTVNFLTQPFDPEVQRLSGLTAIIAPNKRPAGSGTTSDKDLALYLKGTPGIYKSKATNTEIIEDGRREAVRRQQWAAFADKYAQQYGTLSGAQQAFLKEVGKGTRASPLSAQEAGDRSSIPRGAYYYDPQGGLRRNDNGSRGNPAIEQPRNAFAPAPRQKPAAAQGGGVIRYDAQGNPVR